MRWSKNRRDFTPWHSVTSGVALAIEDEIVVLEYRVEMKDGWTDATDGEPLRPSVTTLAHTEVTPARKYFVTMPQKASGLPVEYLLTANVNALAVSVPKTMRVMRWFAGSRATT